jgi:hypothetical protein
MKRKLVRYISLFFSGFLLMLAISFYMDYSFEEEILKNLADHVRSVSPNQDPETLIVTALNTSNFLEERTSEIFKDKNFQSLKVKFMSTSFDAYNFGGGACGSYTLFLARLLKNMGFKVKIIQVRVNGVWGGHNTLGVEQGDRLLLLDPLFNCAFKDSTGRLSDIHEVANNWSMYSTQLPKGYNPAYDYQSGWRYTNWDKFGFLSRSAYKIGAFFLGKSKMDKLSVHYYYLGMSRIYFLVALFSFFVFFFILLFDFLKNKKRVIKIAAKKSNTEEGNYVEPAIHSA